MRRLLSMTFIFVMLLMAFNCDKNNSNQMKKAKVVFSGSVAADGCGWLIVIDGDDYSPINLEESFQQDGIKVYVELLYLETGFQCGMNPDFKIPQVEIKTMKHLSE